MTQPIGPGDWVECVEEWTALYPVRRGAVYRVSKVFETVGRCGLHGDACEKLAVRLDTIPPGVRGGYCSRQFRPIYRPREHAFDYLLTDIPQHVREGVGGMTPEYIALTARRHPEGHRP